MANTILITKYYWALLIGLKTKTKSRIGTQYYIKERLIQTREIEWYYKEHNTSLTLTSMLLICIIISKIKDRDWLVNILHNNPIRQEDSD